ncbi:transglutaminase family protein [Paenibacillus sp. CMAA1364]
MTQDRPLMKYDWVTISSYIWIWIVARQWLSYTEPIWLEQTTLLVERTVIMLVIIEMLLPIKRVYRMLLESVLGIVLLRYTLIEYGLYVPSDDLYIRMQTFISASQPYIWFACLSAIVCLITARFVTSKWAILIFMGVQIVTFAILDSFTSDILWDEAVWLVFVMLGWLVSHQLKRFKQQYPQGWKQMLHYPFQLIAQIVLIFSIIFLLGVNMPKFSPILKDPYTLWNEKNATSDGISESGSQDKDNAGPTISGYRRDDRELGGAFEYNYDVVMTVQSSKRSYWRGETRRLYSGKGWTSDKKDNAYEDVRLLEQLNQVIPSVMQTETVEQTIKMMTDRMYPVLFGAYRITSIETLDDEKDIKEIQWKGSQDELHWNGKETEGTYPKTYSLISEIPMIPTDELLEQSYNDLYKDAVDERYLQIPDDYPKRVKELAVEVTQSAKTPYEQILLLQAHLQNNYTYTNKPDLSRKISDDFVDSFLFEVKQGYCDYFSSSIVMMARSLDIPARWVKGYAPGNQLGSIEYGLGQQEKMNSGVYNVTNADAHSWAEIYFGPYGWIPIEATPGFDMPILESADNQEKEPVDQPEIEDKVDIKESKVSTANTHWLQIISAVISIPLFLWLGYKGYRSRHSLRFLWFRLRQGKELTSNEKVFIETERWLWYVHRHGMIYDKQDTLRETVFKWKINEPTLEPLLMKLLVLFEKAKYSSEVVDANEWVNVDRVARELKQAIRAKRKR